MAIQMRRGNEVDFNADKMLPGEWAISLDKHIVRMCFSPGVVLRMATYEAFEKDMEQIQTILAECQDIETAISLIKENVNASAVLVEGYKTDAETYRNEAEQYRNETKQYRDEVGSLVDVGIATKDKAGLVKPDGTTLSVSADGTLTVIGGGNSGTLNYAELENKPQIGGVELSGNKTLAELGIQPKGNYLEEVPDDIVKTTDRTLLDSYNGGLKVNKIIGKAEQNGTPTPDAPVEIDIAGASGSVEVVSCGKNLQYNSATYDGWLKANTGGEITNEIYNGGKIVKYSDAWNYLYPPSRLFKAGTYTISFDAKVSADGSIYIYGLGVGKLLSMSASTSFTRQTHTFTLTEDKIGFITVIIPSGSTVGELYVANIQLEEGSIATTYEPYTETTATIATPDGLCGIKVSSGGNYVDENGQQWVCDEIVKYADGSGKRIQRIVVIDSYNGESITTDYMSTTGQLATGAKVLYVLSEPIITDLTTEEIAEIEKLHTFYPVTNIFTDSQVEPDIEVEYGTSVVGGYALEALNNTSTKINTNPEATNEFIGTTAEYEQALADGLIEEGMIVNITDDEEASDFQTQINQLNRNFEGLGGFTPVIDETGKITGYTTKIGGADTVFPFSNDMTPKFLTVTIASNQGIYTFSEDYEYVFVTGMHNGYVPSTSNLNLCDEIVMGAEYAWGSANKKSIYKGVHTGFQIQFNYGGTYELQVIQANE